MTMQGANNLLKEIWRISHLNLWDDTLNCNTLITTKIIHTTFFQKSFRAYFANLVDFTLKIKKQIQIPIYRLSCKKLLNKTKSFF